MKESNYLRIQLMHEPFSQSNPYPLELEGALKDLSLPFIGWTDENKQEAIIRHETGPEIILLASSVVSLATGLVTLVSTWKKQKPKTQIQITVKSAKELKKILEVLDD